MPAGTASLPLFQFDNGSKFISSYLEPVVATPWDGWEEEEICAWVAERWREAFEAKKAENARRTLNDTKYNGFNYDTAEQNREQTIENRIYEVVETLVANRIISKPRPEPAPLRTMDAERVSKIRDAASWYMNKAEWDYAEELRARDVQIFGYGLSIITFDQRTGMPYPRPMSGYRYYPDPSGTKDEDRSYWHLGGPQNTNRLRSQFPTSPYPKEGDDDPENHWIQADGFASPEYDAIDRHWYEFLENASDYDHPAIADSALSLHREGESPTTTTTLVAAPTERRDHGTTTFVVQMIVRDDECVDACYWGTMQDPDGNQTPGMKYVAKGFAPRSPSGFWILSMTSQGRLLHKPRILDDCYMGLPWVVEQQEERTDSAWSRSPIDHAISLQRSLDSANAGFDQNLDEATNAPIVTDDPKLEAKLQQGPVRGGDALVVQPGRKVERLAANVPAGQHFERMQDLRGGIRDIAGVQAALEGSRPPGIEAAAALRHLDTAAQRRLRAKENPASRARALLLRKCLYAMGKKLQPEIMFMATNGSPKSVSSDDLCDLFDMTFADGSGTVEGRVELEDKALALYDRQIIDEQAVLEQLQWPGAQEVAVRMMQRKLEEKIAIASAQAANAPPGGGGTKSSRPGAGR